MGKTSVIVILIRENRKHTKSGLYCIRKSYVIFIIFGILVIFLKH